jgi:hypothetical protein
MKVWHSDITYMKQMSRAASGFELKTKLLRVIKCQFGFTKVRYKGLAKKAAELVALFGLSNLWMARRPLMGGRGDDKYACNACRYSPAARKGSKPVAICLGYRCERASGLIV